MALIASMINKAKNRFSENGVLYLWWGWIVFLCCSIQFLVAIFFNENAWYVWLSTWVMAIFQIFIIKKQKRTQKVNTYTEEINGFIWLVFFICLILTIFILSYSGKYELIYPLIMVLYGVPTFLSGAILKFRPLIIGSISCWIFSIVALFILPQFQLLLVASSVLFAWIIPGYLLRKRYSRTAE